MANNLVKVYDLTGNQVGAGALVEGKVVLQLTAGTTGMVMIQVLPSENGSDYRDEKTGELTTLTSEVGLRAFVSVTPGAQVYVTVSPLTELAVRNLLGDKALPTAANPINADAAKNANTSVGTLAGVSDITGPVVALNNPDGTLNKNFTGDPTKPDQVYGKVLARFSGLLAINTTLDKVLANMEPLVDNIKAAIQSKDTAGQQTAIDTLKDQLIVGAKLVSAVYTPTDAKVASTIYDAAASRVLLKPIQIVQSDVKSQQEANTTLGDGYLNAVEKAQGIEAMPVSLPAQAKPGDQIKLQMLYNNQVVDLVDRFLTAAEAERSEATLAILASRLTNVPDNTDVRFQLTVSAPGVNSVSYPVYLAKATVLTDGAALHTDYAAPTLPEGDLSVESQASQSTNLLKVTNFQTPLFSGTYDKTEANSVVVFQIKSVLTNGQGVANYDRIWRSDDVNSPITMDAINGRWQLRIPESAKLPFSTSGVDYTAQVQLIDSAGNPSAWSALPAIQAKFSQSLGLAPDSDTAQVGDNVTHLAQPTLLGTTPSNVVKVEVDLDLASGTVTYSTENAPGSGNHITLSNSGEFTLTPAQPLADKSYQPKVRLYTSPTATTAAYEFDGSTITVDTQVPTLNISGWPAQFAVGQSADLTFTFSETLGRSLAWDAATQTGDISVTGGTLGNLGGLTNLPNGQVSYTATFIPTTGQTGTASLSIAAGKFADVAGNTGLGISQTATLNTVQPLVTGVTMKGADAQGNSKGTTLVPGDKVLIDVSFNDVINHVVSQGSTSKASFAFFLDNNALRQANYISGSGTNKLTFQYTVGVGDSDISAGVTSQANALIVPTGVSLQNSLNVPALLAAPTSASNSISIDGVAPTVSITRTDTTPVLNTSGKANLRITFSEDPGNTFDTSATTTDIIATGGTLSNWGQNKIANADGTYSYTVDFIPAFGLRGDSKVTVSAGKFTDPAGNLNTIPSDIAIRVDTMPVALATGRLSTSSDTGISSNDNITNQTTPTLQGTGEANATLTVKVLLGTTLIWTGDTPVNSTGNWSTPVSSAAGTWSAGVGTALGTGNYTVELRTTTSAGNFSDSTATPFEVDITPPDLSGISGYLLHDTANDTGASFTDNLTNNTLPRLQGAAEVGARVQVTLSNGRVYNTTAVATNVTPTSGQWEIDTNALPGTTAALPPGTYGISLLVTDKAGNTTQQTGTSFTIDTLLAAQVTATLDSNSDSGTKGDGQTNITRPTFNGTAEALAAVEFTIDSKTYSTTASSTGAWSITVGSAPNPTHALTQGTYSYTVRQTDLAGNTQTQTYTNALVILTQISDPTLTLFQDTSNTTTASSFDTDLITSNTRLVAGNLRPDVSSVQYKITDKNSVSTPWLNETDYNITMQSLPDDIYTVNVSQTTNTGVISPGTRAITFTKDTTALPLNVQLTNDTGNGAAATLTDKRTNNDALTVTGQESGAIIQYSADRLSWSTTYTPNTASGVETPKTVYVRQIDKAGNTSDVTTLNYTLDTKAPLSGDIQGAPVVVGSIANKRPNYSVQAEAGALVELTFTSTTTPSNTFTLSGYTSSTGRLTVAPTQDLTDQSYTVSMRVTDTAGNATTKLGANLTLDLVAPTINTIALPSGHSGKLKVGESVELTLTFSEPVTGLIASDVTVPAGKGTVSNLQSTANPNIYTVTYTPAAALDLQDVVLTLNNNTFTDLVGNQTATGSASSPQISVDTKVPAIQGVVFTGKDNTGAAKTGSLTVGDRIDVEVTFSEIVKVSNGTDISYAINVGGFTKSASYVSGDNTNKLLLRYTVQSGDVDSTGGITAAANALQLGSTGVITDIQTNAADLRLAAVANGTNSIEVDTPVPDVIVERLGSYVVIANPLTDNSLKTDTVVIKFSKPPLKISDGSPLDLSVAGVLTVDGGTFGTWSGPSTVGNLTQYSATFTPDANRTTPATIVVNANTFKDSTGNVNSSASNTLSVLVDTAVPIDPSISLVNDTLNAANTNGTASDGITSRADLTTTNTESGATVEYKVVALNSSGVVISPPKLDWADAIAYSSYMGSAGTAPDDTYRVYVRQTDRSGNVSPGTASRDITKDTSVALLTASLTADTAGQGVGTTTDLITKDGRLTLSAPEAGAVVQYKIGTGAWTNAGSLFNATSNVLDLSTSLSNGSQNVQVRQIDRAGNISDAQIVSFQLDTTAPTLQLRSDLVKLKAGDTATVSFLFNEDPGTGFTLADLDATGGTLSNLAVDASNALLYTAIFTPTANTKVTGSVGLKSAANGGGFTDAAGNVNAVVSAVSLDIDTKPPVLTISSTATSLKRGETASVTFSFDEDPGTSFDTTNDVRTTGGTLGTWSAKQPNGNGFFYTAIFTPQDDYQDTAATSAQPKISVAQGWFTDLFGNTNTQASTLALNIDTKVPTVSVTADRSTLTAANAQATLTFDFSEAPASGSFDLTDIVRSTGLTVQTPVAVTSTKYTAVVTATAGIQPSSGLDISIGAGAFTDALGNVNPASNKYNFAIDTLPPTVSISRTDSLGTLKAGQKANLSLVFGETITGLDLGDLQIFQGTTASPNSGTFSNLVKVDDSHYTVDFAPAAGQAQGLTLSMPAGAVQDLATNASAASNQIPVTVNTQAPTVTAVQMQGFKNANTVLAASTDPLKVGDEIRVIATFSSDVTVTAGANTTWPTYQIRLDNNTIKEAVYSPAASAATGVNNKLVFIYQVTAGDTDTGGGIEANVTALLKNTATIVDSVTNTGADLNVPAIAAGANSIKVDTTPPSVAIGRLSGSTSAITLVSNETITFTFDEDPLVGTNPTFTWDSTNQLGDITISGGGTLGSLSRSINATTGQVVYSALYTPVANSNTNVSISVASNKFSDAAGNDNTQTAQLSLPINTVGVAVPTGLLKQDVINDTGIDQTDSITRNTQPTLEGVTQPGTKVFVELLNSGGTVVWTGNTGGFASTNSWSLPYTGTALTSDRYTWNVWAENQAGTRSGFGAGTPFTIDTLAPAAPTGGLATTTDSFFSDGSFAIGANNDNYTNATTPKLTGTAEAGASVRVVIGAAAYDTTASIPSSGNVGTWSVDVATGSGTFIPSVTVTDRAGNTTTSNITPFTVDQTLPNVSNATAELAIASDTGARDFTTTNTTPVISGTLAEANSLVKVVLDSKTYYTNADATGAWSFTVGNAQNASHVLAAGGYTPVVTVIDRAGNASTFRGTAFAVQGASGDPIPRLSVDTGNGTPGADSDFRTNNTQLILDGLSSGATANYEVRSWNGSTESVLSPWANASTYTTFMASAADQTYRVYVRQNSVADPANFSAGSTFVQFIKDTKGIADASSATGTTFTTSLVNDTTNGDSGNNTDLRTSDTRLSYSVTEPTAVFQYKYATQSTWSTSYVPPTVDGQYFLSVKQIDVAGNETTGDISFFRDTTAPSSAFGGLSPNTALGQIGDSGKQGDNTTNNRNPWFSGSTEAGAKVAVSFTVAGQTKTYTSTSNAGTGQWALQVTDNLSDGTYTPTLTVFDKAGNSFIPAQASFPIFKIDLTAPTVSISPLPTNLTANQSATVTFTFDEDLNDGFTVPTGNFTKTDVTVTDGVSNTAIGQITDPVLVSPGVYTAQLTVNAGVSGNVVLAVGANTFADASGNFNTSVTSVSTAANTQNPVFSGAPVIVGLDASTLNTKATPYLVAGDQIEVQLGFSKPVFVSGSTVANPLQMAILLNGVLRNADLVPSSSGTSTLKFRYIVAAGDTDNALGITTPANALIIPSGVALTDNANGQGNAATTTGLAQVAPGANTWVVDTTDPTVTISRIGSTGQLNQVTNGTIQFTFSETPAANSFVISNDPNTSDVTLSAGSWDLNSVSALQTDQLGNKYITATLIPPVSASGSITVSVAGSKFTDVAGNVNPASNSLSLSYDTQSAPAPTGALSAASDTGNGQAGTASDNITNLPAPTLSGTAAANATITITLLKDGAAFKTYTASSDGTGAWSLAIPAADNLGNGSYTGTLSAAKNNLTTNGTLTPFDVDVTAPVFASIMGEVKSDSLNDTGTSQSDSITAAVRPVITGTTAEFPAVVKVIITNTVGGAIVQTLTTDVDPATLAGGVYTWSVTPTADLPEGTYTTRIEVIDKAGNGTSVFSTRQLRIDTTAPLTTAVSGELNINDDPGQRDYVSTNTQPVLSGKAESNSQVSVVIDGRTYATQANATGDWSVQIGSGSANQGHVLSGSNASGLPVQYAGWTVTSTDAAGNARTVPGTTFSVQVAGADPVIALQTDSTNNLLTAYASDGVTNNVNISIVSGLYTPTTVVEYKIGQSGSWQDPALYLSTMNALPDGPYTVFVRQQSSTGVWSQGVSSVVFTKDATASTQILSLVQDTANPDVSGTNIDNRSSNGQVQLLTTAEAGAKVEYTIDPVNGTWDLLTNYVPPSAANTEVTQTLYVRQYDKAGNYSTPTAFTYTFDNKAPDPAGISGRLTPGFLGDTGTGTSTTDNLTNLRQPTYSGIAEIGAGVAVTFTPTDGGGSSPVTLKTVSTPNGWQVKPSTDLLGNSYSVNIVVTDLAGNATTKAGTAFNIDSVAPTITSITPSRTTLKFNETSLITFVFTEDPGNTFNPSTYATNGSLTLTSGGTGTTRTALFAPDTGFAGQAVITLPAGASFTDTAGNYNSNSQTITLDVDTAVPAALTVSFNDTTNGAPGNNSDGYTNDPTINIVSGIEAGTTVQYRIGSGAWLSLVDYNTAMAINGASGANGLKNIFVRQIDTAGNDSVPVALSFTLDRTAPSTAVGAFSAALVSDSTNDTGVSTTDAITRNATPTLAGIAEAGSKVALTVGGQTYTVFADAITGIWSLPVTTALATGTYTPSIVVTDTAGNAAPAVNGTAFTVDIDAPTVTSITATPVSLGAAGYQAVVTFNFAEAVVGFGLDDLEVTGGQVSNLLRTKAATAGSPSEVYTATFTPVLGINAGSASINLKQTADRYTDLAGNNNNPISTAYPFNYDTSAPSLSNIERGGSSVAAPVYQADAYLNASELAVGASATFTVTFSEPVKGLSASNFSLTTQGGTAINGPSLAFAANSPDANGLASAWTVSVTALNLIDILAIDSLKLQLVAPGGIVDNNNNTLSTASYTVGPSYTIDAVAPVAPVLLSGNISASPTPKITGRTESSNLVSVSAGGATYLVTADTAGFWTVDTSRGTFADSTGAQTLTSGSYTAPANAGVLPITYVATDLAGNIGLSGSTNITINDQAPVITTTGATNDTTPIIRGTAPAGAVVQVTVGGATYTVTAFSGDWAIDTGNSAGLTAGSFLPISNGLLTIGASIAASNLTSSGSLVIDTVAPTLPVITSSAFTKDTTPVIEGTAEAFSKIRVSLANISFETTTTAAGTWKIDTGLGNNASLDNGQIQTVSGTFPVVPNVVRVVTVQSFDLAGSATTQVVQTLTIDTTPPSAATIDSLGAATGSNTPTLSGTAEPGATVTVVANGATYKVLADAAGRWLVATATEAPVSGAYNAPTSISPNITITASQADKAGNVQSAPPTQTVLFSSDYPVITSSLYTNQAQPTVTGTAQANATVSVSMGGATYQVVADGNGFWQVNTQTQTPVSGTFTALAGTSGTYAVSASVGAGAGLKATQQTLWLDRVGPLFAVSATPVAGDDTINAAELGAVINGTVEDGASVTLAFGSLARDVTANNDGTWSYAINAADIAALGQSAPGRTGSATGGPDRSIIARAKDRAGNETTAAKLVTVDTVRPVVDLDRTSASNNYLVAYARKDTSYPLNNRSQVTQTDAQITETQPVTRIDIGMSPLLPLNGDFERLQIGGQEVQINGANLPSSISFGGYAWSLSYFGGTLSLQSSTVPPDARAAQALLRSLSYINKSGNNTDKPNPLELDRVFTLTVYDRAGNTSIPVTTTVSADGDGPVIDLNGADAGQDNTLNNLNLAAVNAGVLLQSAASTASLTEINKVNWLQVAATGVADAGLEVLKVGSTSVRLDGVGVTNTSVTVGSDTWLANFVAGAGLRFALSSGSAATPAQAQDLLRALSYQNNGALGVITDGARVFSITAQDTAGNITAVPALATLILNTQTPTFAATNPLVTIDANADGIKGDQFTLTFSELVKVGDGSTAGAVGGVSRVANWVVGSGATLGAGATITAVNPTLVNGELYAQSFLVRGGTGYNYTTGTTLSIANANVVDTGGAAAAGGTGSVTFTMTDIVAPAPAIPPLLISGDNKLSSSELAGNTSVTFTHVAAIGGDILQLYRDGAYIRSVNMVAGATTTTLSMTGLGDWGIDGSHSFTVRIQDAAGNLGRDSTAKLVTVDTSIAQGITSMLVLNDTGAAGAPDANDVIRVTFNEAVAMTTASLPTNVFGSGASVTGVGLSAGTSQVWDIRLGTGADIANVAAATSPANQIAFTNLTDSVGNIGSTGNFTVPETIYNQPGKPTILNVSGDNVINAAERGAAQTVSIQLSNVKVGDHLVLMMDGVEVASTDLTSLQVTNQQVNFTVAAGAWGADGLRTLTSSIQRTGSDTVNSNFVRTVQVSADSSHWASSNVIWFDPDTLIGNTALGAAVSTWNASGSDSVATQTTAGKQFTLSVTASGHASVLSSVSAWNTGTQFMTFTKPTNVALPTGSTPFYYTGAVTDYGSGLQYSGYAILGMMTTYAGFGGVVGPTTGAVQFSTQNGASALVVDMYGLGGQSFTNSALNFVPFTYGVQLRTGGTTSSFMVNGTQVNTNTMVGTLATTYNSSLNAAGSIGSQTWGLNGILQDTIFAMGDLKQAYRQEIDTYLAEKSRSTGTVIATTTLNASYDLSASANNNGLIDDMLLLNTATGKGNDTVTVAGTDYVNTGAGNDTVKFKDLNFRQIDGGQGFDTLAPDSSFTGATFNLTDYASNARGKATDFRTNSGSGWFKGASSASWLEDVAMAPDNTNTADQVTLTNSKAAYDYYQFYGGLTPNTSYTYSLWVKLGTATDLAVTLNNAVAIGTIAGDAVYTSSNGLSTTTWKRIDHTFTTDSSGGVNVVIGATLSAETANTQSAGTVFVWGAEINPTSALPAVPTTAQLVAGPNDARVNANGFHKLQGFEHLDFTQSATKQTLTIAAADVDQLAEKNLANDPQAAANTSNLYVELGSNDYLVPTGFDALTRGYWKDVNGVVYDRKYSATGTAVAHTDIGNGDTANLFVRLGDDAPEFGLNGAAGNYTENQVGGGTNLSLAFNETMPVTSLLASDFSISSNGGAAVTATSATMTATGLTVGYSTAVLNGVLRLQVGGSTATGLVDGQGDTLRFKDISLGTTGSETIDAQGRSTPQALFGRGGNDVLRGGSGDDLLAITGTGNSNLTGGAGADIFRFLSDTKGTQTVTDFSLSQGDKIDLRGLLAGTGFSLDTMVDFLSISKGANSTVLTVDLLGSNNVTLPDVNVTLAGVVLNEDLATLINQRAFLVL